MPDHDALKKLLVPFPKEAIGKLPKGNTVLDFVGHAATTKRLLEVDPEWSWEPLALDENGLPRYDKAGGLWIKLTICGVTRLGYGDGPDPKQRIGDAIRNAAMRFGVALDLWAKEDISETVATYHGWASQADHDAFKERVRQEASAYGDAWTGWAKSQKLAWPLPLSRRGEVEGKLEELRAASVVQDAFPEAEVVG